MIKWKKKQTKNPRTRDPSCARHPRERDRIFRRGRKAVLTVLKISSLSTVVVGSSENFGYGDDQIVDQDCRSWIKGKKKRTRKCKKTKKKQIASSRASLSSARAGANERASLFPIKIPRIRGCPPRLGLFFFFCSFYFAFSRLAGRRDTERTRRNPMRVCAFPMKSMKVPSAMADIGLL